MIKTARKSKGRSAAVLVGALAMLLSTVAFAPSAFADPYIGPYGEPRVEDISGPWQKIDRPRGEESRNYLPGCPRYYVCLYVLSNQTSSRNYWYVFRLYDERGYTVSDFNYNTSLQWIINNQVGGSDGKVGAETLDSGIIMDRIACYPAPDTVVDPSRQFRSANWYDVWNIRTNAYC
ncbi:hypothetical protein ACQPZP_33750 [Spirillospora sp. CA-142024]|uniref:hypothetical protein n=1 Tax=Spirillospora sp. CA-142024 TaxID=3240036 RepID=UPI003D8CC203